jgi:hypothetical protein
MRSTKHIPRSSEVKKWEGEERGGERREVTISITTGGFNVTRKDSNGRNGGYETQYRLGARNNGGVIGRKKPKGYRRRRGSDKAVGRDLGIRGLGASEI